MFALQEKYVNITSNYLHQVSYMISLPDFRILVLENPEAGGPKSTSILDKFKIKYELWDLVNDKVLRSGNFDTYGVNYLSDFSYYNNDTVCILRSANAERCIQLFDFVNGTKRNFNRALPYEEFQVANYETKVELIAFPDSGIIVMFEKIYMQDILKRPSASSGSRKTSEDINGTVAAHQNANKPKESPAQIESVAVEEGKFIIYLFTVFQEHRGEPLNKLKIRRDKPRFRKENVAMRANLNNTLVFCDYFLGEIMIWNIFKPQDTLKYFSLYLSDFKILKSIACDDSALLIVKEKNHKFIQVMDISLKEDKCLITNLINEKLLGSRIQEFGGLLSNKAIFFRKWNKNYILLQSTYKNKPYTIFINLFESLIKLNHSQINSNENHFNVVFSLEHTLADIPSFRQNDFHDYVICFSKSHKHTNHTLDMKLMFLEYSALKLKLDRNILTLKILLLLVWQRTQARNKLSKLIVEEMFEFLF